MKTTFSTLILAGGLGTRLKLVLGDAQKVLAKVEGKPFLTYLLDNLIRLKIHDVIFCTGFKGNSVRDFFGDHYGPIQLNYSHELSPQGTGGALREASSHIQEPYVLVLNGDTFCEFDLEAFFSFHLKHEAQATLLLTKVEDSSRYGKVHTDDKGLITSFAEKNPQGGPGWINAGVYLFNRPLLNRIPIGQPISLEREILPYLVGNDLYGFQTSGLFIDIGTPESYASATAFFSSRFLNETSNFRNFGP